MLMAGASLNLDPAPPPAAHDALTELELRVARRADELVRARAGDDPLNISCWLAAEREVLGAILGEPDAGPRRDRA